MIGSSQPKVTTGIRITIDSTIVKYNHHPENHRHRSKSPGHNMYLIIRIRTQSLEKQEYSTSIEMHNKNTITDSQCVARSITSNRPLKYYITPIPEGQIGKQISN